MRVGILTFHRAWNYGAVLQCYALQQTLKEMGHDAYVIDYRQPDIDNCYENNNQNLPWKGTLKAIVCPWLLKKQGFLYWDRIRRNFRRFRDLYFNLTPACSISNIPTDFDAYVIGSDQLWVPDWIGGHFDDVYFGEFQKSPDSKVIGYAISSNERSVMKLASHELNMIKKNFSSLSFREEKIKDLISDHLGQHVCVSIDPTLLLKKESWTPVIDNTDKRRSPYMVTYHLPGRYGALSQEQFMFGAKKVATKNKLKLIDLSDFEYTVSDFVSLIAHASLVLTSSFHATVFSLIFNRPLMALQLNDGYDGRYVGLLDAVCAKDAIYGFDFSKEDIKPVDYSLVNQKLAELRNPSLDFLRKSLG